MPDFTNRKQPARLSLRVTVAQATVTQTGLPNRLFGKEMGCAMDTCALGYEPVLDLIGDCQINSFYRCPAVNLAVGGAEYSQHTKGEAVDFKPLHLPIREAFAKIAASAIPYDQLILEPSPDAPTWIHLSITKRYAPRKQLLIASAAVGGRRVFRPYQPGEFQDA